MIVVALSVALSLLFPVQADASDACADVVVVGVRGSGQVGYGEQVGGVVEAISAELWQSGLSVSGVALDYPAVSITDSFGRALLNGDYGLSVNEGAAALIKLLDDVRWDCPASGVILVGYSQGAHVIKLATLDRPPIDRIISVVLLADPVRDTVQPGVLRIRSQSGTGALGTFPVSEHIRPVTIDVCTFNDPFCTGEGLGFSDHIEGYVDAHEDVISQVLRDVESVASFQGMLRIS